MSKVRDIQGACCIVNPYFAEKLQARAIRVTELLPYNAAARRTEF